MRGYATFQEAGAVFNEFKQSVCIMWNHGLLDAYGSGSFKKLSLNKTIYNIRIKFLPDLSVLRFEIFTFCPDTVCVLTTYPVFLCA